MPNSVTLQLQIQNLQQQLQANQEELLKLKTKDTPVALLQSRSIARRADLSHHGISPDRGMNLSIPGDGEHEQHMELSSNARMDRDLHHRSTNKRVSSRSKLSVKNMSTSSSSASQPPSGKHPSLQDKMRSLEAQMAKIKRQQEDNDDTDSEVEPLHPSLKTLVVPTNTKMYKGKYDGQTDPSDHVASFVSHYDIHGISDQLKCRIFPSTLTGPVKRWYTGLGEASIRNFKSLRRLFMAKFGCTLPAKKSTASLMDLQRGEGESLRNFLKRFNRALLDVESLNEEWVVQAFMRNVKQKDLVYTLHTCKVKTIAMMNEKAKDFADVEELHATCHPNIRNNRDRRNERDRRNDRNLDQQHIRNERHRPRERSLERYTPLNTSKLQVMNTILREDLAPRPPPINAKFSHRANLHKRCEFHRDVGHTTKEC